MESQAFITSTKKTPTCDVLGPSGLVIDLFLLCQAGNLLKIRSTRLRSVFLQIYKLYPCIYYINNVSINQLWMIWPGKRAERRGVGEVLGLCLHWGSWGDPHFKKKHFQSTPSSVKIIEPSHHFSIYNPFQSIFLSFQPPCLSFCQRWFLGGLPSRRLEPSGSVKVNIIILPEKATQLPWGHDLIPRV